MLWKPSASNSLWEARRLPSLPDLAPAINRTNSFEYEASASGQAQGPAAAREEGAKGKTSMAVGQDNLAKPVSKGAIVFQTYLVQNICSTSCSVEIESIVVTEWGINMLVLS